MHDEKSKELEEWVEAFWRQKKIADEANALIERLSYALDQYGDCFPDCPSENAEPCSCGLKEYKELVPSSQIYQGQIQKSVLAEKVISAARHVTKERVRPSGGRLILEVDVERLAEAIEEYDSVNQNQPS